MNRRENGYNYECTASTWGPFERDGSFDYIGTLKIPNMEPYCDQDMFDTCHLLHGVYIFPVDTLREEEKKQSFIIAR